jgi:hypothetical protein
MILAEMFPNIKWILVDPNIHYLRNETTDQYEIANEILYFRIAPVYNTKKANIGQLSKVAKSAQFLNLHGVGLTLRKSARIGKIPANISEIIAKSDNNYFIIEDLYTNEISGLLEPLNTENKVLFISDIRTDNNISEIPTDLDILWNSAMMYNWIKYLKPARFMLKFRCLYNTNNICANILREYNDRPATHPAFAECDIKFIDNIKVGIFTFIKAEKLYLQAYAGLTSTETRLVANNLETMNYNNVEYEEKLYYYNRIWRNFGYHNHDAISEKSGVDRCADCALSCAIVAEYARKYTTTEYNAVIGRVLLVVGRNLKSCGHKYYDKMKLY